MAWYTDYRLTPDGDGYVLEIYLDMHSTEFSGEYMGSPEENPVTLDKLIKKLAGEKFKDVKINTVKLMVGAVLVASVPFVANFAATPVEAAASSVTALNTTGIVTASKLNVRTGPSTGYSVMHVLWKGNQIKVIGEASGWYQIKLSDGRVGWVSKMYLQLASSRQQKINTVIATAKSLLGTPYVWGGESLAEGGFDCSGLTQYTFKQAGFALSRTSAEQAKQGTAVSRANIQAGDLVFYDITGSGGVNHVGIYIGSGIMIHSPKAGDVVKSTSITTSYWESRFMGARRMF